MLGRVSQLEVVELEIDETLGRVLAVDVVSTEVVPAFANSAMDGFAVRSVDTSPGAELAVITTIAAGSTSDMVVGPGQAARIMTGAALPDGADSVVMVELTEVSGDRVRLIEGVEAGRSVRPAGDDIGIGDLVLEAGCVLTPAAIAAAATVGRRTLPVVRAATVGVFSTGDELVDAGVELATGQIRDSNRHALLALVRQTGAVAVDLGLVADDPDAIATALVGGAARCDAIVTSGGVSMGDFDYVKVVLDRLGEMRWMQIAIKPAKPLAFGTIPDRGRDVPVFGLPGNPVSSQVSFELFARPALRLMMGHRFPDRQRLRAVAIDGFGRAVDGKMHFVRVRMSQGADGRFEVGSSGRQGSHHSLAMAAAEGLAVLGDGDGVAPGGLVDVIPLG